MTEQIVPGVVMVNRFVPPGSQPFKNYVNYIDRENAVRNENFSKIIIPEFEADLRDFGAYNDYMGNPEKTTELFTGEKDELSDEDKKTLKSVFEFAEKNNSLMWQTVISFDNQWLEKYKIYNSKTKELDEDKLKEVTRGCMNSMLSKENLSDSSVWSAAIHYNTDNIHIHIATVEPTPTRETKVLRTICFNSKWVKEHISSDLLEGTQKNKRINAFREKRYNINYMSIVNELKSEVEKSTGKTLKSGNYIKINRDNSIEISFNGGAEEIPPMASIESEKETQLGVFKQSSIRAAKSFIVNEISNSSQLQQNINNIIRKNIYGNITSRDISKDRALRKQFLNIYRQLPNDRRTWKYGMNAMSNLRPQIDELVDSFVNRYNSEDWKELNEALDNQTDIFRQGYGLSNADEYKSNKTREFYQRCGNAILKEMQTFDKNLRDNRKKEHAKYYSRKYSLDREIKIMRHTMKNINKIISSEYEHEQNLMIYEQEFEIK